MINQLKYFLAAIFTIPLIPILFFQGKKIRKNIPQLPEATNPNGIAGNGNSSMNLLVIGESTMAGVGVDTHQNGFTGALAEHLSQQYNYKINWKVIAKSGYTAHQVAKILIPQINDFQPDLIVIGLGANDAFHFNSPRTWRKGMTSIFTRLNNTFPNIKIVCLNMPLIKAFPAFTPLIKIVIGNHIELLGKELKALVEVYDNIFFLDKTLNIEDWGNEFDPPKQVSDFFSDGVHPSKLTYQMWGKKTCKYIVTNHVMELSTKD